MTCANCGRSVLNIEWMCDGVSNVICKPCVETLQDVG